MTDNLNDREVTVTTTASRMFALHMGAFATQVGERQSSTPDSVTMHKHGLTAEHILYIADANALPVRILPTSATVRVPIATAEKDGISIEYVMFTSDISEAATSMYEEHNQGCRTDGIRDLGSILSSNFGMGIFHG